jgi:hypothetical protein
VGRDEAGPGSCDRDQVVELVEAALADAGDLEELSTLVKGWAER